MARNKKVDYSAVEKIVYVYLRVSTEKQKKDGKGLEAQLADCERTCQQLGLTILKVVEDPGLSGKLPHTERPGLLEAMEGCAAGLAGGIIAYNQDRYARGLGAYEAIVEHAKKYGYKLYAGHQDITEEENDIPADALAFVANIERKLIVKRLRGGRIQRAEVDGRGTAPLNYGYTVRPIGELLEIVIDEERAEIVRIILRLVKLENRSYRYAADYLNRLGYKTPFAGKVRTKGEDRGKPFSGRWSVGQIQKIVDDWELYTTGRKVWNGIEAEQRWPILFDETKEG